MTLSLPELDGEGFLCDYRQWSEGAAEQIAANERITLSAEHWQVLHAARAFYARFQRSPDMRPLVKWVGKTIGPEFGNSIALLTLFPDNPARLVSKIAGLPKPANCL